MCVEAVSTGVDGRCSKSRRTTSHTLKNPIHVALDDYRILIVPLLICDCRTGISEKLGNSFDGNFISSLGRSSMEREVHAE